MQNNLLDREEKHYTHTLIKSYYKKPRVKKKYFNSQHANGGFLSAHHEICLQTTQLTPFAI